jgi:L-serine dehydratase
VKLSALDLYTIGIGPSSSHTVGPMRAAAEFAATFKTTVPARVRIELFGSLALTGKGHGTHLALAAGLTGANPEKVAPEAVPAIYAAAEETRQLTLNGRTTITFDPREDIVFNRRKSLPFHPNGMEFTAFDASGAVLLAETCFSIGGGFVVNGSKAKQPVDLDKEVPYPFHSGEELLECSTRSGGPISQVVLKNEASWRSKAETLKRLDRIWEAMQECVRRGLVNDGVLPGGLKVPRRAPALYRRLCETPERSLKDSLTIIDWVNAYAIAVNEENAAGGRVVTAPTNGAAGVIPAVMHYCDRFLNTTDPHWHRAFLLTAGAIGILFKENASISGADVGCQGEVGVACSMAAGALAEIMGGTPTQVENAAEIGMEHNLGLTCDPIGGLVQIPCIERNAMGAVKAINAARIALRGDGRHAVSLDAVIRTMRETGKDMRRKYKETSRGGLAVNVVEC